jgi:hypothetical protein
MNSQLEAEVKLSNHVVRGPPRKDTLAKTHINMPSTTCQSFTTVSVEKTGQSIGLPASEARRKSARTEFLSDRN